MSKTTPLIRFDKAVSAWLKSQRALGRAYRAEEDTLNRLRRFLLQQRADDLTGVLFDAWRQSSARLSVSTRLRWQRTLRSVLPLSATNRAAQFFTRSSFLRPA